MCEGSAQGCVMRECVMCKSVMCGRDVCTECDV